MCCKFIVLPCPDEIDLTWLLAHSISWVDGKLIIPCRCRHLTKKNLCRIHDNKPESCKYYPKEGQFMFKKCGYMK